MDGLLETIGDSGIRFLWYYQGYLDFPLVLWGLNGLCSEMMEKGIVRDDR